MRKATVQRTTLETDMRITLRLDEAAPVHVQTPLPFLDHMLEAFACHGRFGLEVAAEGDVHLDPHHLVEDCGRVLGEAVGLALGEPPAAGRAPGERPVFERESRENRAVARAGFFIFPMDGSLAQVALDLCGRPNLAWRVPLEGTPLGGGPPPAGTGSGGRTTPTAATPPGLFRDFFKGLCDGACCTLHVDVPVSDGDHHALEAVFKAFGRALRMAVAPVAGGGPLSTKGTVYWKENDPAPAGTREPPRTGGRERNGP